MKIPEVKFLRIASAAGKLAVKLKLELNTF